ncbi:hypothetical protein Poly41_37960 [Novipirellula artificiosorum]|uniref:Uncharacterized protein n=1 Tax=Novipirellula artificiosorum TaxID=2528016 RepID=A0A5C6DFK7_9BACT|nr:hypothetical protein Poly41_37960 [Novipirellula artificiosorum]
MTVVRGHRLRSAHGYPYRDQPPLPIEFSILTSRTHVLQFVALRAVAIRVTDVDQGETAAELI